MTVTLDELLPAPEKILPRDHLSASSLGTFARCPEQFRRRYLLGERERPAAALIWGSADDFAHTTNFEQKIETHADISQADVELAFVEGFDQAVERDGGAAEVDWGEQKPGELKDAGVRLVSVYHRQVSPLVQPVAVQRDFMLAVAGVPVPIIGRIDLEQADELNEWKVASRGEREPKPQWRTQGRLYQAATGKPLEWHVKARTKIPAVYTAADHPGLRLPFSRVAVAATEERIRKTVAQLLHLTATLGPDEPWPTHAPDYGWACGYCGFRPTCAWWAE